MQLYVGEKKIEERQMGRKQKKILEARGINMKEKQEKQHPLF